MMRLLVAAEDALGHRVVVHLVDLRLRERGDAALLDGMRVWLGHRGAGWMPIKSIRDEFRRQYRGSFFRVRGHFDGAPGAEDALMMRMLFTLIADGDEPPHVLVVARDVDGTDRRIGFEQARRERAWPFAIVGALAQPETEAWLIASCEPRTSEHEQLLRELRRELGFDPVRDSHRLTSTGDSPRDCKRVRQRLDAAGCATEGAFLSTPLDELARRGEHNGLGDFLTDLRQQLDARPGGRSN